MDNGLTKKQTIILDFITQFITENEASPSYREIAAGIGLSSVASVSEHVDHLIEKGFLKKNPGAARSLEVVLLNNNTETERIFHKALITATPEEKEILKKAAKILNINL